MVSTVAAIVAAGFAISAYKAARAQADSAAEQTTISREQAAFAAKHYVEQQAKLANERARREQRDKAQLLERSAREDAERPRWLITKTLRSKGAEYYALEVKNTGESIALKVSIWDVDRKAAAFESSLIVNGGSIDIEPSALGYLPNDLIIQFTTVFGSKWTVRHTNEGALWPEYVVYDERSYVDTNEME